MELISALHAKGIFFLSQICERFEILNSFHKWKTTKELGLIDAYFVCWKKYIYELMMTGITYGSHEDVLG